MRLENVITKPGIDNDTFFSKYGRSLNHKEQQIALEMHYIISHASGLDQSSIYPNDPLLGLFGKTFILPDCSEKLVLAMDTHSVIQKYNLNLRKIRDPEIDGRMIVAEFIDSVILSSNIMNN